MHKALCGKTGPEMIGFGNTGPGRHVVQVALGVRDGILQISCTSRSPRNSRTLVAKFKPKVIFDTAQVRRFWVMLI